MASLNSIRSLVEFADKYDEEHSRSPIKSKKPKLSGKNQERALVDLMGVLKKQ